MKPLAIIGMHCRLPGADSPAEFRELLQRGESAIQEFPSDRLDRELYFDANKGKTGKTYATIGGFIKDRPLRTDLFADPQRVAQADLCHQIFCEVAATACLDTGRPLSDFAQKPVGVYVGHSAGTSIGGEISYAVLADELTDFLNDVEAFRQLAPTTRDRVLRDLATRLRDGRPVRGSQGEPNVEANVVAGLVADALQLTGPQFAVEAACASGLVALKMAAIALELGQIDAAVVGGASYNKAESLVLFSHAQSCSARGSRPFDADADGLVSSEGYVAFVVKTLEQAKADGDPVRAVIRGIGMSSDGRGKNLWAPRKEGQVEAIRRAYGDGVDPRHTDYVEAHATSTNLGDLTELEALSEFFGSVWPGERRPIGSVKSNVGHTLETAGLAGLLKVIVTMQHGEIPPSINCETPNPAANWDQSPFQVATTSQPWQPHADRPRRAAVNAFGIGGLNVHVVVDETSAVPAKRNGSSQGHVRVVPEAAAAPVDVAIIGRGVVLPGAFDIAAFEQLLREGRSEITDVPPERRRLRGGQHRGGFIRGYQYDWQRHMVPPLQIARANPLQFMLLDAADQAFDESGYASKPFDRKTTAVVVGAIFGGEFGNHLHAGLRLPEFRSHLHAALAHHGLSRREIDRIADNYQAHFLKQCPALIDETGSFTSSTLASRLGKTFDLMGGALALDAGDCSSFAALATACDLLADGQRSMVLCGAGQRAMDLPAFETLTLTKDLAVPGRPGGYHPGEGVAVVLLKRLQDAVRDGDPVHGVIRGIGAAGNADRAAAVQEAARAALTAGRLEEREVDAITTGCNVVRLDEPERAALQTVYRNHDFARDDLVHQIGHTQAAHGLVSLIRWTLQTDATRRLAALTSQSRTGLAYHVLIDQAVERISKAPRGVGEAKRNPPHNGDAPNGGLHQPTNLAGTNDRERSHAVATLASADSTHPTSPTASADGASVYRFSAATLQDLLRATEAASPASLEAAYAKPAFPPTDAVRLAVVARHQNDLHKKLSLFRTKCGDERTLATSGIFFGDAHAPQPRLAVLFPGQGSQYLGMLRNLVTEFPAARQRLDDVNAVMDRLGYESFEQLAWGDRERLGSDLWTTQAAMLLANVISMSIVDDLHLRPFCYSGHSFGEFAALVAAGACSLEQAVLLTRARAEALDSASPSATALLAVHASSEDLADSLPPGLFISHRNAPSITVVGGPAGLIDQFATRIKTQNIAATRIEVPCAFHTPYLAAARAIFETNVAAQPFLPPSVPVLSSVTNRFVSESDEIQSNLVKQLTEPIDYVGLIHRQIDLGVTTFIEIGPQQVLTRLVERIAEGRNVSCLATDHPRREVAESLLHLRALLEAQRLAGTAHAPAAPERIAGPGAKAAAEGTEGAIEDFDATARRRAERRRAAESVPEPSRNGHAPASATTAAPPSTAAATESRQALEQFLIDFVIEHTGYPRDVVSLDADLETDLGVDSIKKAQLFGELRELTGLQGDGQSGTLADFKSLRQILEAVESHLPSEAPAVTAPAETAPAEPEDVPTPAASPLLSANVAAAGLEQFLIDFVIEHTGYPRDVVSLDADLESDLGVDSIKKAQLFGELRELTGLSASGQTGTLADFKTLRQIRDLVAAAMTTADSATDVDETSDTEDEIAESAEALADEPAVALAQAANGHALQQGPHFLRGLERGRSRAREIRNYLRTQADSLAYQSTFAATTRDSFSPSQRDQLRGLADGAEIHPAGIFAHGRGLLDWEEPSDEWPRSPWDEWEPDAPDDQHGERDETAGSGTISKRFLLRTVKLPHLPGTPEQPVFHGAAAILGDNGVARALKMRLEAAGVTATILRSTGNPAAAAAQLEQAWERSPICHVFLTTPRDENAATKLDWQHWRERRSTSVMSSFLLCQKWVQLIDKARLWDRASLVATTSLGGGFGFQTQPVAVESGAIAGMCKAICIENWVYSSRTTPVKLIDTPAAAAPEAVVDAVWRELAVPTHDLEVAWRGDERFAVRAVPAPVRRPPSPAIHPGGTWVLTGGARGVTAYVAKELGRRFDLKLHLIGTAAQPELSDRWRELFRNEPKRLKSEVLQLAQASGRNSVRAWQDTEKALEIDQTLRELADMGVTACYHSCDVSDREALAAVLDEVRRLDGPIEGILHGAGIGRDARFDRKDLRKVDQCISAKVDGAFALMELTQGDPLRYFVAFGSISGRFGANGHTDYSLANDMLARQIGWYRRQRPEVAAVAFHWHAWDDVGMATRPETRLALEMINMQFMPAKEAVDHLVTELAIGAPEPEILITDDRYYRTFDPVETRGRETYPDTVPPRLDRCVSPLLRKVRGDEPHQASFEVDFDPKNDPFLKQHLIDGRPVLPMVIALECMAEAAAEQAGRKGPMRFREVRAVQGLRFYREAVHTARITARPGGHQSVACEITADFLNREGRLVEANRTYFRGIVEPEIADRVRMQPSGDEPSAGWAKIAYAAPESKVYHGPPLQTLTHICVEGSRAWGRISAPALIELAGAQRRIEGWVVPSAALDACLYATALLAGATVAPVPSLPVSIDFLELGRMTYPGEACLVEISFVRKEGRNAWFDFALYGQNHDLILTARDYCVAMLDV